MNEICCENVIMLMGQNNALEIYLVWPNWMEMKVSDREFAVGGNKFANLKPIRQILGLGRHLWLVTIIIISFELTIGYIIRLLIRKEETEYDIVKIIFVAMIISNE